MGVILDLWDLHRERILQVGGILLCVLAVALVLAGGIGGERDSYDIGSLLGVATRNVVLSIIVTALGVHGVRRFYWEAQRSSERRATTLCRYAALTRRSRGWTLRTTFPLPADRVGDQSVLAEYFEGFDETMPPGRRDRAGIMNDTIAGHPAYVVAIRGSNTRFIAALDGCHVVTLEANSVETNAVMSRLLAGTTTPS